MDKTDYKCLESWTRMLNEVGSRSNITVTYHLEDNDVLCITLYKNTPNRVSGRNRYFNIKDRSAIAEYIEGVYNALSIR